MTLTTLHRPMTALTLALFGLCFGSAALAQTYPTKPVRVLVGFAAGSSTDVAMRLIGPRLGEILGQNVLVDNRAGAGGNIAAELTAKAPADGHTLLFANGGIAIAQSYYTRLEYNALKDLAPVALVTSMPHIVCSNLAFPAKTIKELVALAKQRPGDILFSSAGIGNSDHMAGELFGYMTGSQYACAEQRWTAGAATGDLRRGGVLHGRTTGLSAARQIRSRARTRRDHSETLAGRPRHPDHAGSGRQRL